LLLNKTNYNDIKINDFSNLYSINYWVRLLPISNLIKKFFIKILNKIKLDNFKIKINVGNIIISGRKDCLDLKRNRLND